MANDVAGAIVAFTLDGRFPDTEEVAARAVGVADLEPAIEALGGAKADLESQIESLDADTQGDVAGWVRSAKAVQDDIIRSKAWAAEIARQADAPAATGREIAAAEERIAFIAHEAQYADQLCWVLEGIRDADVLLGAVEEAAGRGEGLDALRLLEKAWAAMDRIPVARTCRVMRLLSVRSFELKSSLHDELDRAWKALVAVDVDRGRVTIGDSGEGSGLSLTDVVVGLKAYKEVDERMEQLWHNLDATIVGPRMRRDEWALPRVRVEGDSMGLGGEEAAPDIDALLDDIKAVLEFLSTRLPLDLLDSLSATMMADLVPRLVHVWLDAEVPSSLSEMDRFQHVIASAAGFCQTLQDIPAGAAHAGPLREWVDNAPSIWLAKCRETALESIREKLTAGIVGSKEVERVERRMVEVQDEDPKTDSVDEDQEEDDWGWGDEADEGGSKDGDGEEWDIDWEREEVKQKPPKPPAPKPPKPEANVSGSATPQEAPKRGPREVVMRETYRISSMPEPVLDLVFAILEDGAALTQAENEGSPVAAAAGALFSLPTLALSLFRAISPHYYSKEVGGNMYLYNDATYLADRLTAFSTTWQSRPSPARDLLRLDTDIAALSAFANRSYTNELALQKTILRDLVGGDAGDAGSLVAMIQSAASADEADACVDAAVARVLSVAAAWEGILARSAWAQAVGSLADALAKKVVADVLDMTSIGQEDAYRIARMIARVTELDQVFLPSRLDPSIEGVGEEIPQTAKYAPSWLRLKYLSELLQANLMDVRYLWFESELSLWFSADEVVDLIGASFEANERAKGVVREIQAKPRPIAESMDL